MLDHGPAIEAKLEALRVPGRVVGRTVGPTFVRYTVAPEERVRARRIVLAAPDIGVALGVEPVRAELDANGVWLDVPRDDPEMVALSDMAPALPGMLLPFALGRDVGGADHWADLARMPHLLIAGATGTGKSVALNALLVSMLREVPARKLRLLLIDAKRVELSPFAGIEQLWGPIVTEVEDAERALAAMVDLMERRFELLAKHGARQLSDLDGDHPRYVVVVDELADLVMSSKPLTKSLIRLAQKARAAGIHLVLATQRPSSDVISGLLKANVPGRMALATVSGVDSRVILDVSGAEDLLGRGDMLFKPPWLLEPVRLQGCYVDDADVRALAQAHQRAPVAPVAAPVAPVAPALSRDRLIAVLMMMAAVAIVLAARSMDVM